MKYIKRVMVNIRATVQIQLLKNHQYTHDHCILYELHYHSRCSTKLRNQYCIPCQLLKHVNINTKHNERALNRHHDIQETLNPHMQRYVRNRRHPNPSCKSLTWPRIWPLYHVRVTLPLTWLHKIEELILYPMSALKNC